VAGRLSLRAPAADLKQTDLSDLFFGRAA